jgi:hypothetical protein
MTISQPAVAAGQIWLENDPPHARYVLVTRIWRASAVMITCNEQGLPLPDARRTDVSLTRFHGKRSGYKFVGDAVSFKGTPMERSCKTCKFCKEKPS